MPTMHVNGATIAYTDTAAPASLPEAATVMFGHGLLFGGWMFRRQIAALRQRYRCVTIDWRGQGDTPATADGYDMDTLTDDAVAVIRELGVGPVHWVGLSMGGFVGQRLAARHGDVVRSLALLDTSAEAEDRAKVGEYKQLAAAQLVVGVRPLLGRIKPFLFGPRFLADPAGATVIEEWAGRLTRFKRAALRKALLGVTDRAPVDEEIAGITTPTLVIVGADDQTFPPAHAELIASRIPDAQLHVVEDCGHSSSLEQPEAVTGLLEKFLATVE